MKAHGAYLVPTLATYVALADEGESWAGRAAMLDKLAMVHARGIESLKHRPRRRRAGGLRHRPAGPHACAPGHRVRAAPGRDVAGGGAAKRHHRGRAADAPGRRRSASWCPAPGPTCWWSTATRRASCRCWPSPQRGPLLVMKAGRIVRNQLPAAVRKRARSGGPSVRLSRTPQAQDPPGFTEVKRASGRSSARCTVVTPFFMAQGRSWWCSGMYQHLVARQHQRVA